MNATRRAGVESGRALAVALAGLGLGGCGDILVLGSASSGNDGGQSAGSTGAGGASASGASGAVDGSGSGGAPVERVGTLWAPTLDYQLLDATWAGDPHAPRGTVTFTHEESGDQHVTGMYYAGDDTWSFRFTGTRLGRWSYRTASDDPDLDAHEGALRIDPNPDPMTYGFATEVRSALGTQWARRRGNEGDVEVFVPQLIMMPSPRRFLEDPDGYRARVDAFFEDGFNGIYVHTVGDDDWFDDAGDPNPETFEAIETIITHAHATGAFVHLWGWDVFDQPTGGLEGPDHIRLLRYLAARLGPLPGWSLSYGMAGRWTTEEPLQTAVAILQGELGWPHYAGGRADGPRSGTDHSPHLSWQEGLGFSGFTHLAPPVEVYEAAMEQAPDRPVLSEDRFRVRDVPDPGDPSFEDVIQRFWTSTMAGGVGNVWANFADPVGDDPGAPDASVQTGSAVFTPEVRTATRTYRAFWAGRLDDELQRDSVVPGGQCLRRPDGSLYLVYAQDTQSIEIDLAGAPSMLSVVAVDTRAAYDELPRPSVPAGGTATIELPDVSDWALVLSI